MIVIVDSDGLIGVSHETDTHYLQSVRILEVLRNKGARLIYPATTIAETTATLQIRLGKRETADKILEYVQSGIFEVEPVDYDVLVKAISFFRTERSKHITLFDCVVAAIAKEYNADAIFSFDKFYKRKGFKLAMIFL